MIVPETKSHTAQSPSVGPSQLGSPTTITTFDVDPRSSVLTEPPPYAQLPVPSTTVVEKPLPANPASGSVGGLSSPERWPFETIPRSNLVYIKQDYHIKGLWAIDPNVQVPKVLQVDNDLPEGPERPNLYLRSEHGHVTAKMDLLSNEPTRSIIDMSAPHGHLSVKILSRRNQKFKLKVETEHGYISVRIPTDFEGPITISQKYNSPYFSPPVMKRLAYHSRATDTSKAFLGSLVGSQYSDDNADRWLGDEMILSTAHGYVTIAYIDEPTEGQIFMKDLRGAGPIVGPLRYLGRKIFPGSRSSTGERTGYQPAPATSRVSPSPATPPAPAMFPATSS